ncbi:MAG: (Fe-S)-binding protein [Theionarchaea archaeon]|nr:(Fe-S)-binding protein [Theionarchaea archaeon]
MMKEFASDIYACARCGDCRDSVKLESAHKGIYHVCPVREQLGFDSYTARGKLMVLREVLEGKDLDEDIADLFYTCLECGSCKEVCISQLGEGIDVPSIVESFRAILAERGFVRKEHNPIIASIKNYDNPWQMPRYRKAEWTRHLGEELPSGGDILFFAGCSSSLLNPNLALSVVRVFQKLEIPVAYLGKREICCGSLLKRIGALQEFEKIKKKNMELFAESGAKTIITTCAGCYRTLKIDYGINVQHITEYLDEYRKEHGLTLLPFTEKVTYHDPCHLGRHCGVYMEPRNLIRAIPDIDFKEMERHKEFSWCCGSGAGIKTYGPALAVTIARGRLDEAHGRLIISTCPYCEGNLQDAGAEVIDIIELYADLLEGGEPLVDSSGSIDQFMEYLTAHTDIFSEIKKGGILLYEIDGQFFTVEQTSKGTEIKKGEHDKPDLLITLTQQGVSQLMSCDTKEEYLRTYKYLYKETDHLDFVVKTNMFTMARRGYVVWAKKAGLLSL